MGRLSQFTGTKVPAPQRPFLRTAHRMTKISKRRINLVRAATTRKKKREPERDYSHRLLIDKLGVKPGQRVAVLGVESPEFLKDLAARVPEYSRGRRVGDADLIFFSAEAVKDLDQLKSLEKLIQASGAIWVVYPKGQAHIREVDVIAAGKSVGLVDNKVCRFSDTHTAMRFVIPLARR
jgi:hypothetical protein